MKKFIPVTAALFILTFSTSCKKEYTCECVTTYSVDGVEDVGLATTAVYTGEAKCSSYESQTETLGTVAKTICTSK